jgi:hypothetical protein
MKTKMLFLTLGLFWLIACKKDDFDLQDPDVDQFISIVRKGHYFNEIGYELPDFKMRHIKKLLHYCTDTSIIDEFPTNPYSSRYTEPKILNECLFWTVDGIRYANKYPSMEPCLWDTSKLSEYEGYSRLTGEKLLEVSELYLDWYADYEIQQSETLKTKNLFENTTYTW